MMNEPGWLLLGEKTAMFSAPSLAWFRRCASCCMLVAVAVLTSGCETLNPWSTPPVPQLIPADDSMVIRSGRIEQDLPDDIRKVDPLFVDAEELYKLEDYRKAERLFHKVAENTKNPALVAEKARFFEAECQRLQNDYPSAMASYNRLLSDFSFGVYKEQSVAQMFTIANYWLKDTWVQLDAEREKEEGKRWFVPSMYLHTDKSKPTFDEEGHALRMLEQVYFNDPTGPYADKALYLLGYVHFSRKNFREADQFLSQLVEMDDKKVKGRSELRDQAFKMAILAKSNCSGGPLYDGRKHAEALRMIQNARATSPKVAQEEGEFLDRQMVMIRYQQAEKDFQLAEFYRRTGKPASAWFYYELVRRRYQGTEFHDKAVAKMKDLQQDLQDAQETGIAAATRRTWNEAVLGHDTPKMQPGAESPALPDSVKEANPNPIVPVGGSAIDPRSLPKEVLPRQ